jgi:hypothetical protein
MGSATHVYGMAPITSHAEMESERVSLAAMALDSALQCHAKRKDHLYGGKASINWPLVVHLHQRKLSDG